MSDILYSFFFCFNERDYRCVEIKREYTAPWKYQVLDTTCVSSEVLCEKTQFVEYIHALKFAESIRSGIQ